jgi:hypothetical protein
LLLAIAISDGAVVASANETKSAAVQLFHKTAAELGPQLQTGSLLFNKGDCLAIRVFTASPYTHVAIVVVEEGEPVVYDSQNGVGVRRQSLAHYLVSQSPDLLHVFHPRRPLSKEQGRALADHLESELGRPYAVHHHLTGHRCEGVHCAEYVTDALMSIELLHAERPCKVSPASLVTGITCANIYTAETTIELTPPAAAAPVGTNRCHQLWLDTKQCMTACCNKLSGWFLCR